MNTNITGQQRSAMAVMANDWIDDRDGAWFWTTEPSWRGARSLIKRGLAERVPCDETGQARARLTKRGAEIAERIGMTS